jgi:RNA polymerase sigma-70 factor, ECF subfamily
LIERGMGAGFSACCQGIRREINMAVRPKRRVSRVKQPLKPVTPPSLLERLRQPHTNGDWERFVAMYTPLLRFWARRLGVHDQDAADLLQEVFATLLRNWPTLQVRAGNTFRGWLRMVTRNKWIDMHRRRRLLPQADAAILQELPAPAEDFWEVDFRRYLVKRALDLMQADFQPATWRACWDVVALKRPAAEVALDLGLSIAAVRAACCRVLARLRAELGPMLH